MKSVKPLLLAIALLPALVQAHPGHPALPAHQHASALLESPVLGLVAGLGVVAVLLALRWLPRRPRLTATRRR
jgi:ABC-type transport system involved in cytochrome c biogenesis permease subunit